MSPEGYIVMAEMIANQQLNIEGILAEVRRGMADLRAQYAKDCLPAPWEICAWCGAAAQRSCPVTYAASTVYCCSEAHQQALIEALT
jgi:hypothetical protein